MHESRGYADVVRAIEIGYKKLGLIQTSTVTATATAGAQAPAAPGESPAFKVYEAGWVRRLKEEAGRAALERNIR